MMPYGLKFMFIGLLLTKSTSSFEGNSLALDIQTYECGVMNMMLIRGIKVWQYYVQVQIGLLVLDGDIRLIKSKRQKWKTVVVK